MPSFQFRLADDKKTIQLALLDDAGNPLGVVTYDAAAFDNFIMGMGKERTKLQPPAGLAGKTTAMQLQSDPRWQAKPDPIHGLPMLLCLHQAYGHLGFVFPPKEAESLGRHLMQLAANAEKTDQGKPN